jgi:hypothetical protein
MPRKIEPDHGQAFVLRKREEKKHAARVPEPFSRRTGQIGRAGLRGYTTRASRHIDEKYIYKYVRTYKGNVRACVHDTHVLRCLHLTSPHLLRADGEGRAAERGDRAHRSWHRLGGPDDPHHSSRFFQSATVSRCRQPVQTS